LAQVQALAVEVVARQSLLDMMQAKNANKDQQLP
jgi:hypothetical protein